MAPVRKRSLQKGKLKKSFMSRLKQFYWYDEHYYQAAVAEDADLYIAHDLPMLRLLEGGARQARPSCTTLMNYTRSKTIFQRKARAVSKVESALIGLADAGITVNESIAGEMVSRYRLCKVPDVILNCTERLETFDLSRRYTRLRDALPCQKTKRLCCIRGALG